MPLSRADVFRVTGDKRDLFCTCWVRTEREDGRPLDIPEHAGECAKILGRVGDSFTLGFSNGHFECQVHEDNLHGFTL